MAEELGENPNLFFASGNSEIELSALKVSQYQKQLDSIHFIVSFHTHQIIPSREISVEIFSVGICSTRHEVRSLALPLASALESIRIHGRQNVKIQRVNQIHDLAIVACQTK
jgi:hypothetical protein